MCEFFAFRRCILFHTRIAICLAMGCLVSASSAAESRAKVDSRRVLEELQRFYQETARPDGSFQPGVDPAYLGMSDSAHSDLAAVTYACTIHQTFGWKLPHPKETIAFLLSRQKESGEFVNVAGTVDAASPQGKVYNTTQALVALHALGAEPRYDPLPVFDEILRQDYKSLPAYSTSFFPLAYLCAGRPVPAQADQAIRAQMVPDQEGYLNSHIAATFHASHYHRLLGEPAPRGAQMVKRILREQKPDGSWLLHRPARDRHATFDAVFTLRHEGQGQLECQQAIEKAAQWALSCRNDDGGFGHFPGSTSDADAVYFQVGTLVMAGFLKPADPLPKDPHLLSWGHLMPLTSPQVEDPLHIATSGWAGGVAFSPAGDSVAGGLSDNTTRIWSSKTGVQRALLRGHENVVVGVAYSPDGKSLATASYDQTAKIWELGSDKVPTALSGHRGAVLCVAYSPDGALLATGGIDQTVRLWDSQRGTLRQLLRGHKSWVNSLAFEPQGKWLVSASSDGTLRVWSIPDGKLIQNLAASPAEVRSVAVSSDGKYLAAGIRYGSIKVWETAGWKEVYSFNSTADDVWSLAFTPDNAKLVAAAGTWNQPTEITSWGLATGQPTSTWRHPGEVLCLAVSRDGKLIAAGGGDQTLGIWKANSAPPASQREGSR